MNKITYIKKEQKRIAGLVTGRFRHYYLTGGTALAFHFDHRFSEDLDFFSQKYDGREADRIMDFIARETGFSFKLDSQQDMPGLVPMKVYFFELKGGAVLKIDFVQDFVKNIKKPKSGLHSIEDIYYRKIYAATGGKQEKGPAGQVIATGRQSVKDLFDIYYLSSKVKPLSDFFFEHLPYSKIAQLDAWYRGFNKRDVKLELVDLVEGIDPGRVFKHLDQEILKKIPDRLL